MNKQLLLLALALGSAAPLAAQDLIVKRDSTRVEARVQEISPEQIRYKRYSNPDGPTYVLPAPEIAYIRYANGEIERFGATPSVPSVRPLTPEEEELARRPRTLPANPPYPVAPVPQRPEPEAQDPAQNPKTLPADPPFYVMPVPQQEAESPSGYVRRYEIGEFYNENGVQGVVCQLNEDRTHGLILSLEEGYVHWCEFDKKNPRTIGTTDESDGRVNMARVAAYIAENNLSWDDFPAFKWCLDRGEGWYLPAINEILTAGNNFNGGNRTKYDRQARSRFNDALKNHGGKRMDRLVYYFSSTEQNAKSAYVSHMDMEPPYVIGEAKNIRYLVRAVRRF